MMTGINDETTTTNLLFHLWMFTVHQQSIIALQKRRNDRIMGASLKQYRLLWAKLWAYQLHCWVSQYVEQPRWHSPFWSNRAGVGKSHEGTQAFHCILYIASDRCRICRVAWYPALDLSIIGRATDGIFSDLIELSLRGIWLEGAEVPQTSVISGCIDGSEYLCILHISTFMGSVCDHLFHIHLTELLFDVHGGL